MSSTYSRAFGMKGGCYTCDSCGKKTRETGEGESGVGFCRACYIEGGLYNAYQDGELSYEEYVERAEAAGYVFGETVA